MKRLPIFLGIFILIFFLFLPQNALAQENYNDGAVLFQDNFNQNNLNNWQILYGNWQAINNFLIGLDYGQLKPGRINPNDGNWNDYRFEVDVNNAQGVDDGLGFRWNQNSGYEVTLRHGYGDYNTPEIILNKTTNGQTSQLFETHSITLNNSQYYHIKIEAVGDHLQMWVGSTLVFDLDDTNTQIKNGTISLSYWTGDFGTSNVRFDNVKVTSLNKQRFPVIFIPGIGGSELGANNDLIWSQNNGHGGTYSHAYQAGDTIWVNPDEAISLGDDDYFDVLRLNPDGQTSSSDVGPNGNLTPYGYSEIYDFFTSIGYQPGVNFFVYTYDWRKDIKNTSIDLDALVNQAIEQSGKPKVNIVSHSMGGLVSRNYIQDPTHATKVNKEIELGVPHLGAVDSIKDSLFGDWLAKDFYLFKLGISPSETKDVIQNFPSAFELLPSSMYFNFYNNSNPSIPFPFRDDRDIDNNGDQGALNFSQIKILLDNLHLNMVPFNIAEAFHNFLDPQITQTNGVNLYEIVGSAQPTLGQIRETWWITWPIKLFPKTDEIYINGDGTVPLYSASLKSDSLDLSANAKIYYVEQKHEDMPSKDGIAMKTVKIILEEGDILPSEVKDQKISLSGTQISADKGANIDIYDSQSNHTGKDIYGNIEQNIPGTFYSSLNGDKHVFIKKNSGKVKVTISTTSNSSTDLKIRDYSDDSIDKTSDYVNVPTNDQTPAQIQVDSDSNKPPVVSINDQIIPPYNEVGGDEGIPTLPINSSLISSNNYSPNNTSGITQSGNTTITTLTAQNIPSTPPLISDQASHNNILDGISTAAESQTLGEQAKSSEKPSDSFKKFIFMPLLALIPLLVALGITIFFQKNSKSGKNKKKH